MSILMTMILASSVYAGPNPPENHPDSVATAGVKEDHQALSRRIDEAKLRFTRDADGNPVCTLKEPTGDEVLDLALCRVATLCARENWGDMQAVRACVTARKGRIMGLAAKEKFARTPMP